MTTLGWELIEELPSSAVSFEDSEIDNPFPPIPAWNFLARVWYRVVAIDNTSLESSHCGHQFSVNVDYLAGQPGQQEVLNLLPLNEVMIRELGGNLWPNPSNSWVNFEPKFEGDTHGESNVSIMTVSGELVTSESFTGTVLER
ncbi:MAG: hypothetical protein IPF79_09075 [Ignavibacteria bacterium]|nr:hypothetical protein [Ignavibacteria bacterium]